MPYIDPSNKDGLSSSRNSISGDGKKDHLRVIIVGGSVTGLTLAHCLHHCNIDFVLLEAGREIAPQVGASIAVLPNGLRIFDQLRIFDDISALVEPLLTAFTWTGEGKLIVKNDTPLLLGTRSVQSSSWCIA